MKTRDLLLNEVHHRVKNNLQLISSLLSLEARESMDPTAQAPLRESQNRLRALGLVHDHLCQSGDSPQVALHPYIQNIAERLIASRPCKHQLHSVLDIESLGSKAIPIDVAVSLGLISNEILNFFISVVDGYQGKDAIDASSYMKIFSQEGEDSFLMGFQLTLCPECDLKVIKAINSSHEKRIHFTGLRKDITESLARKLRGQIEIHNKFENNEESILGTGKLISSQTIGKEVLNTFVTPVSYEFLLQIPTTQFEDGNIQKI